MRACGPSAAQERRGPARSVNPLPELPLRKARSESRYRTPRVPEAPKAGSARVVELEDPSYVYVDADADEPVRRAARRGGARRGLRSCEGGHERQRGGGG